MKSLKLNRKSLNSKQVICGSLVAITFALSAQTSFAQSATSNPEANQAVETVIVTATKRNESLTDVPIALSVVGARDIEQTGIRELSQVTGYVPNVQVSSHNDFRSVITIRGVGSNSRNIGFDSRVGVYVDGVYMGQSPSANQELLDLARVEVLRGPQGMLFGKNTVAGAIALVTNKPGDEFRGKVSANFGNYGHTEFKGLVNVPLGSQAAAKFSIAKTDTDGYILNTITGNKLDSKDVLAWRGQLRVNATEKLEFNLSIDGLSADNLILVGEPLSDMLGLFPISVAPEPKRVAFDADPQENRKLWGGSFDAEYKMDNGMTLKSITAYRDTKANYTNQTDYSPTPIIHIDYSDDFEQLTQELQAISPRDAKFTYMVGAYYYSQKAITQRDVVFGNRFHEDFIVPFVAPSVAPLLNYNLATLTPVQIATIAAVAGFGPEGSKVYNAGLVNTDSKAIYINAGYDFSDAWKLGIGARLSTENKSVNWLLDGRNSGSFAIGSTNKDSAGVPRPMTNKRTDEYVSPAVSLSYKFPSGTNIYAKYSTGYKSGGFNLDYINANELAANAGLEFDMETTKSYELGLKGRFLENKLSLNIAGFIADYDDFQVNQFVDLGGGRTSIRITNAAKVATKGVEIEFTYRPITALTFQGAVGFLDGKFDSFPGGGTAGADASGKKLTNAPEFTANLSTIYRRPMPEMNANFFARLDVNHTGDFYTSIDNTKTTTLRFGAKLPFGYREASTLINGRVGFTFNEDKYGVFLWGHNISDEQSLSDDFRDFFGTIVNHPTRGRTYGIELSAKF